MSNSDKTVLSDITDSIYEITDDLDSETIYIDLDEETAQAAKKRTEKQSSLKKSDRLILEIAKEMSNVNTLPELYDILIFSSIGQLGSLSASIIHPSKTSSERWTLARHHGFRLKNRNLTFRKSDPILSNALEKREIVDVRNYVQNVEAIDEYQIFTAVGARLLIPIEIEDEIRFILLLGNRLGQEEYEEDELDFVQAVADMTSFIFAKIYQIERLQSELDELSTFQKRLDLIDHYESSVRQSRDLDDINTIIRKEMASLKINSFAFFFRNDITNKFEVLFTEEKDLLRLKNARYSIDSHNAFISYCNSAEDYAEIENPVASKILSGVFSKEFLIKINLFGIYPYSIRNQLIGFLLILRVKLDEYKEHLNQVKRFTRFVFSHLQTTKYLIYSERYIDVLQPLFSRVRNEYDACLELQIPFTIVLISVKGYDEVMQKLTLDKVSLLSKKTEGLITEKISETDYSFRIAHNRFVIAMPGKYKKDGSRLASILKKKMEGVEPQFTCVSLVYEYPKEHKPLEFVFSELL